MVMQHWQEQRSSVCVINCQVACMCLSSTPSMHPEMTFASRLKPPRACTCVQLLCAAKRAEVKAANPGAGFSDTPGLLAAAWKDASEADRAPFQQQHEARMLHGFHIRAPNSRHCGSRLCSRAALRYNHLSPVIDWRSRCHGLTAACMLACMPVRRMLEF